MRYFLFFLGVLFVIALLTVSGFVLQQSAITKPTPTLPIPWTSLAPFISQQALENNTSQIIRAPTTTPLPEGETAPEFLLIGLDGKQYRLDDFRGKRVVLNFWATWCAPCRIEMPLLQNFYEQHKRQIVVVGINMGEDKAPVQAFIDELKITFPILLDEEQATAKRYRVVGLPSTFFIDTQGIVRATHVGGLSSEMLESYLADNH